MMVKRKRERVRVYGGQDPREIAAYGIGEAARYLSIPESTLRYWAYGRDYPAAGEVKHSKAVIELPQKESPRLSFMNLVEAHILDSIRKKHNIPLPKVRRAIDYLSKKFRSTHPLAEERLRTDDIDLFYELEQLLINVSRPGQLGMRELFAQRLRRIEHDAVGLAMRLYPFTSSTMIGDPRIVVIDPYVSFGKPVIAGTGIPTRILAERWKARESVQSLADDYGLEVGNVEEAIRYEFKLNPAA